MNAIRGMYSESLLRAIKEAVSSLDAAPEVELFEWFMGHRGTEEATVWLDCGTSLVITAEVEVDFNGTPLCHAGWNEPFRVAVYWPIWEKNGTAGQHP
jgi:hypothetical protein